jgi:hypothetical protein
MGVKITDVIGDNYVKSIEFNSSGIEYGLILDVETEDCFGGMLVSVDDATQLRDFLNKFLEQ